MSSQLVAPAPCPERRGVIAVIPCRDEAASIGEVIKGLGGIGIDQVVVGLDPLSSDATAEVARRAGATVVDSATSGYDGPCLAAVAELRARHFAGAVLFLDAGNKYVMASVAALLDGLDPSVDLTFGVRDRQMRWHQRFGNNVFRVVLFVRFRHWARDISSLRIVRMATLDQLRLEDRQFSLPFQTIVHALKLRKSIRYTAITCTPKRTGTSKVSGDLGNSLRAARQMGLSLVRIPKFDVNPKARRGP